MYLSKPGLAAVGEAGDSAVSVGMLQPGETKTLVVNNLRAGNIPGTHHLRAFVDSQGSVTEWSEGDNQMSVTYEINPINMNLSVVPGGILLSWNCYWGQIYTVMYSVNLTQGFNPYLENIQATPPSNTLFIANPPPVSFYKLRVDQR